MWADVVSLDPEIDVFIELFEGRALAVVTSDVTAGAVSEPVVCSNVVLDSTVSEAVVLAGVSVFKSVVVEFDEVAPDDQAADTELLVESVVFLPVVPVGVSVRRGVVPDTLREVCSLDVPFVVEVPRADRVVRNVWDVSSLESETAVFVELIGGRELSVVPAGVTNVADAETVVLTPVVFDATVLEVVATESVVVVLGRLSVIVGVPADVPIFDAVSETVVGGFDEVALDKVVDAELLVESVAVSPVVPVGVSVRRCVVPDTLLEVRSLDVP